jgi:hypothetical protein
MSRIVSQICRVSPRTCHRRGYHQTWVSVCPACIRYSRSNPFSNNSCSFCSISCPHFFQTSESPLRHYIDPRFMRNLQANNSPTPNRPIIRNWTADPPCWVVLPADPATTKRNNTKFRHTITPKVPIKMAGIRYSGRQ